MIIPEVVEPTIVARGRELFDKHILAIGGINSIERHQNKIIVGKVRHFEELVEWRFISYHTQDNRFMIWLQHPQYGVITKGFDGASGWKGVIRKDSSPIYEKLEGVELQRLKQQANFIDFEEHSTWYPQIISVEQDDFAGRVVERVQTINAFEERQDVFFDAENHLLLGSLRFEPEHSSLEQEDQKGKRAKNNNQSNGIEYKEIWTRYGHYVQVQDVHIPFSVEYSSDGKNKVVLLEEAYFDVTAQERDYIFQKYNFVVGSNSISSPLQ
jgi:hypothetical protein